MQLRNRLAQTYDWYRRYIYSLLSFRRHPPLIFSHAPRYAHSLITQPPRPTHLPFDLQIEVTTTCNLRCIMCYGTMPMPPARHLRFDAFQRVVDQIPNLYRVVPQGIGEPLLNPDLMAMVDYAARRGCAVDFHTNAMLLTEARATRLIDDGLAALTVSIDAATAETFEAIRPGSRFAQIVENLERLRDMKRARRARFPQLRFHVVAMKPNLAEMPDILRLAHRLDVEMVIISPVYAAAPSMEPLTVSPQEWQDLRQLDDLARELGLALHFTIREVEELANGAAAPLLWPSDPLPRSAEPAATPPASEPTPRASSVRRRAPCRYPWTSMYVGVNGDVHPCCASLASGGYKLGNVFEAPVNEIWWGEKYQAFRRRMTDAAAPWPDPCAVCPLVGKLASAATTEDQRGAPTSLPSSSLA